MKTTRLLCLLVILLLPVWTAQAVEQFNGLDRPDLPEVTLTEGDWGLQIVFFNVGQADALLLLTPDGEACLIDSGSDWQRGNWNDGKGAKAADQIADFLSSVEDNGVGALDHITLVYTTHYHADHMLGLDNLVTGQHALTIGTAYDQGAIRSTSPSYTRYAKAVAGSSTVARYGDKERLGKGGEVTIRCVAVAGDTEGTEYDSPLDPAREKHKNAGSIALLVTLGEFEFYTAGDQDRQRERDVVDSGAIPGGNDIDLLKVSHHGSTTATDPGFVEQIRPEVAVVSSTWHRKDRLPKQVALGTLQTHRCHVLITGDGTDEKTGEYTPGLSEDDLPVAISEKAVHNRQGQIRILVSADGTRYTVRSFPGIGWGVPPGAGAEVEAFRKTFSAVDEDNARDEQ